MRPSAMRENAMAIRRTMRRAGLIIGLAVAATSAAADPLSRPSSTARQKAYARRFTEGRVYTPQMVVDGTIQMFGSDREAVMDALRGARPAATAPVSFADDRRSVAIGGGAGKGEIVLVRFVRRRTTHVGAGENTGRVA